jgi:hypothetical protein
VDTARKVAEATILGDNNSESSLARSEISNSDESRNLVQTRMEDSNGLILAPECSSECFNSNKTCRHKKEQ